MLLAVDAASLTWSEALAADRRRRRRSAVRSASSASCARRDAGFRTHMLRRGRLGALHARRLPTAFREFVAAAGRSSADPTRIAAQIVTGIGFLGAGAIIRQRVSPCAG